MRTHRVVKEPGRIWVNIVARDPVTMGEWTVWNGFVNAPTVMVDIRPEFLAPSGSPSTRNPLDPPRNAGNRPLRTEPDTRAKTNAGVSGEGDSS